MKNESKNSWKGFILLEGTVSLFILWYISAQLIPLILFLFTQNQEKEQRLEAYRLAYELVVKQPPVSKTKKTSGGQTYLGKTTVKNQRIIGVTVSDINGEELVHVSL